MARTKQQTEEIKEETVAKEAAADVQPTKIELTQEELDAIKRKTENAVRQQIAMEQAKAEAKEALEEEAKSAKETVLSDMATRAILNQEQKYRVTIFPAEGEKNVTQGSIKINGVKIKFKYGEPTIMPESCLSILKNSHTFGNPELVKDSEGAHYEPRKVQKRAFNSEPVRIDSKIDMK